MFAGVPFKSITFLRFSIVMTILLYNLCLLVLVQIFTIHTRVLLCCYFVFIPTHDYYDYHSELVFLSVLYFAQYASFVNSNVFQRTKIREIANE